MSERQPKREKESLADYVRRLRRARNLTGSDISLRALQKGFEISTSYVFRIENRQNKNPSATKLTALAAGLDVTPAEVFAIARGEAIDTPTAKDHALLNMIHELPRHSQEDLTTFVTCLYERYSKKKALPAKP